MNDFRPFCYYLLFSLTSSGALWGGSPDLMTEPSSGRSKWSWNLSPTWHRLGDVSLKSNSRSQNYGIPPLLPGDSLIMPPIGATDEFADRTYEDGFVNVAAITPVNGKTWYWGYDEAGQISGRELMLHATGSESIYQSGSGNGVRYSDEEDLDGFAPQLDLNFYPEHRSFGISGVLVSLSYTDVDTSFGFSNFDGGQSQRNYQLNFTDTYALGDVAANPPTAPYEGSEEGPGPSIPNKPMHRDVDRQLISTDSAVYRNSIDSDLDLSALSLAVGPTFEGAWGRRWRWQAALGTTLTLYDYEVSQDETLTAVGPQGSSTLQRWHDSDSGTRFGVGLFIRGSALYELNDNGWFASGFLQLETGNSFDLDAGEASFTVDPDGFSIGLGIGRMF